ncbi:phage holin, LLH family [Weissella paramesenteroides]|uniref:phage holin, LLH family n=1 Tax=Weissella paramesenteroides TaxID=1249 RepID=UPI003857D9FB
MNINHISEWVLALWSTGVLKAVAHAASRFFVSHTKNKNLLLLNEWAMQAVQYAETHLQGSAEKKQSALNFLTNKLNANKLGLKFDSKQLDAVIELAVSTLHGGKTND